MTITYTNRAVNNRLVRCTTPGCNVPAFEVREREIVHIARHQGENHESRYQIDQLDNMTPHRTG